MKSYENLEEAYIDLYPKLVSIARRHIYNQDYAQDAVQDAFTKTVIYTNKHKGKKVSGFIIARELMRACRRINKKGSFDTPTDFSTVAISDLFEDLK